MRDCLLRGEAPYASHALYTQPGVLDDGDPESRKLGMTAGFSWRQVADATIVYTDLGTTDGMRAGIERAEAVASWTPDPKDALKHRIEYRTLGPDWEAKAIEIERAFKTKWP